MLVTLKELLDQYMTTDKAVGAFNVTTFCDAKPVITAAEKKNAPVIVQVGGFATRYMDLELWGKVLVTLAERSPVPVCIHLDHSKDVEECQRAIDAGFSSVMYDGSQLPYEENVRLTSEVVRRAAQKGVSVEGEIGSVAYSGTDAYKAEASDPDTAARFVADTGIDAVAVAVGTLHRMETQAAHLNFELLRSIQAKVDIPLVIHGSSGLCDEDFKQMCATHVTKVNIGTALRMAFDKGLRTALHDHPESNVFTEIAHIPMQYMEDKVIEKLGLLGF